MKTSHSQISACRHCRYYEPEGRRGGNCQQLNVAVQGAWNACALAIPPFSPAWENFEDIMVWQQKTLAAISDQVGALGSDEATRVTWSGDRTAAASSFSSAMSSQVVAEPTHTKGIKALWM